MAVNSVGLQLKCDCSCKYQKQFNSKLQARFLTREDALKAERRNCQTKEEKDKIWSRVPKGGPIPRLTGRLAVGRKTNSNSNCSCCVRICWSDRYWTIAQKRPFFGLLEAFLSCLYLLILRSLLSNGYTFHDINYVLICLLQGLLKYFFYM
jgi:hypothetical protein